jgi:hypothetical protein
MYEYILYSYIGVLIIVLIKGYKNFYVDYNSTNKYTLFNDDNNLNTFLINNNDINSKEKFIIKKISLNKEFIYNLKKKIDDRINSIITTIKNKFRKKKNNIEKKNTNIEDFNSNIDDIENCNIIEDENILEYNNNNLYNLSYIDSELSSTLNTSDINISLHTTITKSIDSLQSIYDNEESLNNNTVGLNNVIFYSNKSDNEN